MKIVCGAGSAGSKQKCDAVHSSPVNHIASNIGCTRYLAAVPYPSGQHSTPWNAPDLNTLSAGQCSRCAKGCRKPSTSRMVGHNRADQQNVQPQHGEHASDVQQEILIYTCCGKAPSAKQSPAGHMGKVTVLHCLWSTCGSHNHGSVLRPAVALAGLTHTPLATYIVPLRGPTAWGTTT